MKAAVRLKYGLPEVLSIKKVAIPTPKENEVLIRVYATTVNRSDCHVLWGKPFFMRLFTGLFKPRLASTGTDFAGQIVARGEGVKTFKVGDKVMGFGGVFGCGSHAQYLSLPETKAMIIMPDKLNYEEAAACLEGAIYAFGNNRLNPHSGQKALVIGATGAIGSAMVQILKSFGTNVIAVCQGENKALVESLGADIVIDYTKEDFTKGKDAYDFVFDAVGKSSFGKCKPILKKHGIYSSSHPSLLRALTTSLSGGRREVFLPPPNIKAALRFIKDLIEKNCFWPVIDKKYPLEKIVEAFNYVASGQKIGNVIITMND
jgi:NADPH:quinone reductase-like Zn-dependent oxidoreductase